jgi:hypothetical protein
MLVEAGHNGLQGRYETVAASQTDQVLGSTGAGVGDYIERLICVVATPATSNVLIQDGDGTAITVLPAAVAAAVGTYVIEVGAYSVIGAWSVTTGAGVSVLAIGKFR